MGKLICAYCALACTSRHVVQCAGCGVKMWICFVCLRTFLACRTVKGRPSCVQKARERLATFWINPPKLKGPQ